jgi:hypothetical protein
MTKKLTQLSIALATASQSSPSLLRKCRIALVAAGLPESEADEKAVELAATVQAALEAAPSPDMRVQQVSRYRNESSSTTQRKMRWGVYDSYLSGPDMRLVTRASVEIDRGVCLLLGPRFDQGGKRGRPKKALESLTEAQGDPRAGRGGEAPPEADKPADGPPEPT